MYSRATAYLRLLSLFVFISSTLLLNAQYITLSPNGVGPDEPAKLVFDASEGNGELVGQDKVYMHHGVVLDKPDGTEWNNVVGDWGQDNGVGEMTKVEGEDNKWEIEFTPSIREYFNVAEGENIFRISAVFRSADGSIKGTLAPGNYGWGDVEGNLDVYINLNTENYITLDAPQEDLRIINPDEAIEIRATASSNASIFSISIDEGNGFSTVSTLSNSNEISYEYKTPINQTITIRVQAEINGESLEVERTLDIVVLQSTEIENFPSNLKAGINYTADPTEAYLVLEAPGKDYGFVVGDMNDWKINPDYQLKQTSNGEYLWYHLTGLQAGKAYVFQYWLDGDVKIGDPYTEQVADPWNDRWIEESTFPNLPEYNRTEYGLASVLQTNEPPYDWSPNEDSYERPDVDHLMIYELHIRDFIEDHSFSTLIDTIQYLKRLGINAVELMPINEFEGNDSWGYNPSYYFAVDKYYGPKNDLKRLIEVCHENGLAVILDMVLNHAFGQNPMVQMYFDNNTFQVTDDNPWFNRDYIGPYEWGYDFNHESDYTKRFIDRVNKFWIEEFHFDGFRFDFTKGFTNVEVNGSIDGFDQSRIDILKRMADVIWSSDEDSYIILEHWSSSAEERELSDYGMKLWRNKSYDFVQPTVGNIQGSFSGMDATSHVAFFDSHDERRIAEHCLVEGRSEGPYNIKEEILMMERVKMAAAFAFITPGPKMMWQFDELGYDININFNGRTGRKPLVWGQNSLGYYEDENRQHIYNAYRGIIDVRNKVNPANLLTAEKNHKTTGNLRRYSYKTEDIDVVVIGNFGLTAGAVSPMFTQTGIWYNYFTGEEVNVTNTEAELPLQAGEWHVFTTEKLSDGQQETVVTYENPVTISPSKFAKSREITIRFDATKAWNNGTAGLIGADKVYMHSGVVLESPSGKDLKNVVGTLTDDGVGLMTEVDDDIWEITLTPTEYYNIADDQDVFRLGMTFRDADNVNQGLGFRNTVVFWKVESQEPIVTISPLSFDADTEITITYDAARGNRELVGANKVYIHSSPGLQESNPQSTAWQNVVGNWGQDDGVGLMTEVEPDLWQITLTPSEYYGISTDDFPHWIAAVFRSADGSIKGTGTPGNIQDGFIAENLDFFMKNGGLVSTKEIERGISFYPNPTNDVLILDVQTDAKLSVYIYDMMGKLVQTSTTKSKETVDVSQLASGTYILQIQGENILKVDKFVKN